MRIKEIVNLLENGYYPPSPYVYKTASWDALKGVESTTMDDILSIRDELLSLTNNYTLPPKLALGRDGKVTFASLINALRVQLISESQSADIMNVIIEMEDYIKSMD